MPTRETIVRATPRCTASKLRHGQPAVCNRLLEWKPEHAAWVCRNHGHAREMEVAGVLVEAPT